MSLASDDGDSQQERSENRKDLPERSEKTVREGTFRIGFISPLFLRREICAIYLMSPTPNDGDSQRERPEYVTEGGPLRD